MTKQPTPNTGNETTVHNPQKPGTVEKVNPTSGDTTPKDTDNADLKR